MMFIILDFLMVILIIVGIVLGFWVGVMHAYFPLTLGRVIFWVYAAVLVALILGVILTPFGGFPSGAVQGITNIIIVAAIFGLLPASVLVTHRRNPNPKPQKS